MKRIGVLAVQGAFAEHKSMVEQLGAKTFELRSKSDLIGQQMNGIILPGGESTVIGKLLKDLDMFHLLQQMILEGIPVMGTCAGLILLAKIGEVPMTFIRAPYIEKVDHKDVDVLASVDGNIVAARQRNMLVTSFHPELTGDTRVHQFFMKLL